MIGTIVLSLLISGSPIKLMLDWFPNADHVPIYVAQQLGFFDEEGIDLSIQVPANPSDPLKLIAAGKVDVAVNYQPEVVISRSQGLDVISIGILVEHPLTTILFLKESGIKKPSDLTKKTIGYAVPHLQEILFRAFADQNGVTDYKLINIGFNITPSLLTGKVDAVIGAYRNYEKNEIELEGRETGFFALEKHGIPDFYELVFISNSKTIESKKTLLEGFLKAVQKAIDFSRQYPDSALKLYFNANPDVRKDLDRRAFFDVLPLYAHSQIQNPEIWQRFVEFSVQYGLIDKVPEPPLYRNIAK